MQLYDSKILEHLFYVLDFFLVLYNAIFYITASFNKITQFLLVIDPSGVFYSE